MASPPFLPHITGRLCSPLPQRTEHYMRKPEVFNEQHILHDVQFKSHAVRLDLFLAVLSYFYKFCLGLFWVKDQSSLKVFSNGTIPTPEWTSLTWDHLLLANHSILHEPAKQEATAEGFWVWLQKLSFTRLLLMSTHRTARCLTPLWQVTEHCKYDLRVRDEKNGIQWRLAHRLYH